MSSNKSPIPNTRGDPGVLHSTLSTMSLPLTTLSSLLTMQDDEAHKPRLSKIKWLPDVLVYGSSIIPTVLGPVLFMTLFSCGVAMASLWWGREVGLTNSVVPLLSVVVGLLLVFRNSSAYERYSEGRKDFTTLISNARNLSRLIWINVVPPPTGGKDRAQLTKEKKELIRLVVAFVVATKHHLRAEGGVHHADLRGLLPLKMFRSTDSLKYSSELVDVSTGEISSSVSYGAGNSSSSTTGFHSSSSCPGVFASPLHSPGLEESNIGGPRALSESQSASSNASHLRDGHSGGSGEGDGGGYNMRRRSWIQLRPEQPARRPTAVRVIVNPPSGEHNANGNGMRSLAPPPQRKKGARILPSVGTRTTGTGGGVRAVETFEERTPLIKAGVLPDVRKTIDDVSRDLEIRAGQAELGRMVELGLPLIIAHEISRKIFKFRRTGYLEAVGPAGVNTMQALVQSMIDQLGSMERVVQTPLPYIFCVHLKQCVTLYLLCLPFVLVDTMGWKMIWVVTCTAFTLCGVEGIASQCEQPFGTDPCDLNLDLFCTELLCECEALLERLPEGDKDVDDEDEDNTKSIKRQEFTQSTAQMAIDEDDGDGDDGGDDGGD